MKKKLLLRRFLKRTGQVGLAILSASMVLSPAAGAVDAADSAKEVVGSEGGKAALNEALKIARSKPALTVAAGITCVACLPAAGAAASPGLCIACGILIAKVVG